MTPPVNNCYLGIGEVCFAQQPAYITTVLGSCIGVAMYNREKSIGALCHAVQPECRKKTGTCEACRERSRYVVCAIPWMVKQFERCSIPHHHIEVKVFGGADMFEATRHGEHCTTIGKMNITAAFKMISREHLRLISYDVGGNCGRKIIFHTHTGRVFVQRQGKLP